MLSWRHSTGHLHVQSPCPAATWAYCAEMLRKECLELSNTPVQKSIEPEAFRMVPPGLVFPKGLLSGFFKGRYSQPKLKFNRSCRLSFV